MTVETEQTIINKIRDYYDSEGFTYMSPQEVINFLHQNGLQERAKKFSEDIRSSDPEIVRNAYNSFACYYDIITRQYRDYYEKMLESLHSLVARKGAKHIVSGGSGTCLNEGFIAKEFPETRITAYDFSEKIVEEARKRIKKLGLKMDIRVLDHGHASSLGSDYDLVVTKECFGDIFRDEKNIIEAIGQFKKLLRTGGLYASFLDCYYPDIFDDYARKAGFDVNPHENRTYNVPGFPGEISHLRVYQKP